MLPLWQALQGTALRDQAEIDAVLRQIEKTMTASQLAAIAELRLTADDLRTWMEAQGITPPAGPPANAAANGFGNLTEEQRAAIRATVEAGGQPSFGADNPFGNLTEEQRAALRATREAGGGPAFGGAGRGGLGPLVGPLIELLKERAC